MKTAGALGILTSLTWEELEDWAGNRSVERGRSYARSGQVRGLCTAAGGGLLAWVSGGQQYATEIEPPRRDGKDLRLRSHCSCPVGYDRCKHAVAVILAYLEAVKGKRELPKADAGDRRLALSRREDGGLDGDDDEDLEEDLEEEADEAEDGTADSAPFEVAVVASAQASRPIDAGHVEAQWPALLPAGFYHLTILARGVESADSGARLHVREPQPLWLAAGARDPARFGPENDRDGDRAGVQATLALSGTSLPAGTSLELAVEGPSPAFSEAPQLVTTLVPSGRPPAFPAVTLADGSSYVVTAREAATRRVLVRAVVTRDGPPVALAVLEAVERGGPQLVTLDATASRGQFGPLLYRWTLFHLPLGAEGLDSPAALATYRATRAGRYDFALTVSDSRATTATTAVGLELANVPPTADAGPDVQVILPDPLGRIPPELTATAVQLDGRASRDANGDPLRYSWQVVGQPAGSTFVAARDLEGPNSSQPTLRLSTQTRDDGALRDAGDYVLHLTVSDPSGATSTATARCRVMDPGALVPNADAGLDRTVRATVVSTSPLRLLASIPDPASPSSTMVDFVRLDGRESADSNAPPRPLTYHWSVVSVPRGSGVTTLTSPATAFPSFVPDQPGQYRFALTVDNGRFSSASSQVELLVLFDAKNRPPRVDASIEDRLSGRSSRTSTAILQFAAGSAQVWLDGSLTSDPDPDDVLTYSWKQTRGPAVELWPSSTAAVARFMPLARHLRLRVARHRQA